MELGTSATSRTMSDMASDRTTTPMATALRASGGTTRDRARAFTCTTETDTRETGTSTRRTGGGCTAAVTETSTTASLRAMEGKASFRQHGRGVLYTGPSGTVSDQEYADGELVRDAPRP
jgi:hypothetical protein